MGAGGVCARTNERERVRPFCTRRGVCDQGYLISAPAAWNGVEAMYGRLYVPKQPVIVCGINAHV